MENCEQVKNTFPDGNSNLMNHMKEDNKLMQQSPQMSSDTCQIHFLLSQLAQQWQKDRLEIRQDHMFICQYLNSLAERQEQQWHQIQYNHIQSMNETRQNFQALNVLINTVLSQANFTHIFSTQGSELKEDLTETRIQEENMSSQHLGMTNNQDNAVKHETFSKCSENITKSDHNVATDLEINPVVEPLVKEQVSSMPEINVQQQSIQLYHKQGLTDAGRNCQTNEHNVLTSNANERFVTLDISNRQAAVNELDLELPNSREQKEKHKTTNTKINSETNEVSSENNVTVPDRDFHKGKMKVSQQRLDNKSNKKSYSHMSDPVNQSEKELEITQGPTEYKTFMGRKDSHKMYADAVITSKTLPVNFEMHSSIEEIHVPDTPEINPVVIPEAEKSYQGTGIYADAISKLMGETDSSSLSSEKSRASSTGQTYHKTMTRKGMTQSRTKEPSRTFRNTKENRTRKSSDTDY